MSARTTRQRLTRAATKLIKKLPSDLMNVSTSSWHFRLITDVGTDDPLVVGTAFPIGQRTLVTAKHVFEEAWEANDNTVSHRNMFAVQALTKDRVILWTITEMIAHRTADLMLLHVDPEANKRNPPLWIPPWRVRSSAPRKGEMVMAIGYIEGRLRIASRNKNGGGVLEISDRGQIEFGMIRTVHRKSRDRVMLPCPCFEIGASFSPGMSGGPVFDKNGRICGIVSTGIQNAVSSYAVTLAPSLPELFGESFYISPERDARRTRQIGCASKPLPLPPSRRRAFPRTPLPFPLAGLGPRERSPASPRTPDRVVSPSHTLLRTAFQVPKSLSGPRRASTRSGCSRASGCARHSATLPATARQPAIQLCSVTRTGLPAAAPL